jgi:hypothetical protein
VCSAHVSCHDDDEAVFFHASLDNYGTPQLKSKQMNWKKYITDPSTNRPKRGAISRIAALLGTHYGCVRRMFDGVWTPTEQEAESLRAIVASRTNLAPKKRSDAGKKRGQYRKRAVAKSVAVPPQLKGLRSAGKAARKLN